MVSKVKKYKAGFVFSDSNLKPDDSIEDLKHLIKRTGHSTIAITEDGFLNGKFLGLITSHGCNFE